MSDFITRRALDDVEANLREKKEGKRKGFHIGVAVDGSEMSERAARTSVALLQKPETRAPMNMIDSMQISPLASFNQSEETSKGFMKL
eukprot:scaffold12870_cov19-Tisochrysis_lutea.AAC.2